MNCFNGNAKNKITHFFKFPSNISHVTLMHLHYKKSGSFLNVQRNVNNGRTRDSFQFTFNNRLKFPKNPYQRGLEERNRRIGTFCYQSGSCDKRLLILEVL
jgi:hypothetical protein